MKASVASAAVGRAILEAHSPEQGLGRDRHDAEQVIGNVYDPELSPGTHHQGPLLKTLGLWVLMAAIVLGGCVQIKGKQPTGPDLPSTTDRAAADIVNGLARVNQSLRSFSGVGKLTVKRKGRHVLRERVAWVGAVPDKLSLVVFISGFPTLRFASDGKWFYLIEPGETKSVYRRIPASDSALAQIIGIEISFAEVIALLRGRVPLTDYRALRLTPGPVVPGDELALRKWWGVQQRIWLENGGQRPLSMAHYDRSGQQRYRVVFDDTVSVASYQVPERISILAGDEAEFSLDIDRYIPNPEVSPDMFVLTPIE